MASRRSSTASEKKSGSRGKSMTRSKSPFRSFRFKKSKSPPEAASGNYSDDEENLRGVGKTEHGKFIFKTGGGSILTSEACWLTLYSFLVILVISSFTVFQRNTFIFFLFLIMFNFLQNQQTRSWRECW